MSVKRGFVGDHALFFFSFFCEDPKGQACLHVYNVSKHIDICMCDVYLCVCLGAGLLSLCK